MYGGVEILESCSNDEMIDYMNKSKYNEENHDVDVIISIMHIGGIENGIIGLKGSRGDPMFFHKTNNKNGT